MVSAAAAKCRFDPVIGGRIHFVVCPGVHGRRPPMIPPDAQVFAQPLLDAFVFHRWENGSIARWNNVLPILKKIVIGTMLNSILPSSLSGLSATMALTEQNVANMMADSAS